ncbi:putative amidophosphoribosyltransferase [Haloactinopolyspora alba]|uniref:Putative amidophosphoribosyltransferase n=1 Tax=Haloactinopolyspora alba TaxID=648780 RepID=A0A2P8EG65_9ACTN|nr:putative amidophosphoribosyltransferase [Haloactinopolyspora alba]
MAEKPDVAQLADYLVSHAGGYLRNTVRIQRQTCSICTTPTNGYKTCYPCRGHQQQYRNELADLVAPVIYAKKGTQAGYLMHGYKQPPVAPEHRRIVATLSLVTLSLHSGCPGRLIGSPLTSWATVPSLAGRSGRHPLHALVARMVPLPEIPLHPGEDVVDPRAARADNFTADPVHDVGAHVLLLDDTWASGGHLQSAALALRQAGAAHVSGLVLARWIGESTVSTGDFRTKLARPYNPDVCPWTGATCP